MVAVRAMAPVAGRPPKQTEARLARPLGDELAIGAVAAAAEAVGDDGREEGFDAGEEGDCEGAGEKFFDARGVEGRQGRRREHIGEIAEARADCVDGEIEEGRRERGGDDGEEESGEFGGEAAHEEDEGERGSGDGERGETESGRVLQVGEPLGDEVGGGFGDNEAEEIFDLAGEDDEGDAGGEAGDDRLGHIFDDRAEAEDSGDKQHEAGHEGGLKQAVIAVGRDDIEDDDDESAGGAADLEAAAAEGGDDEAGDDGGDEAFVRGCAAGDGERHCQGEGDDGDGEARDDVFGEFLLVVAFVQGFDEFGRELAEGRVRHGIA